MFGTLAITAITAQDTTGVYRAHATPADLLDDQIEAVIGDLPVAAVKTGMLANLGLVKVVSERAAAGDLPNLVVDPVMVASSGDPLLEGDAVGAYRSLLRHARVVTPNLPEASLLLGRPVKDRQAMAAAARDLYELGPQVVVVKGGHLPDDGEALDVVFDGSSVTELSGPWITTRNVHGSGCTLSAAVTAGLALGLRPLDALVRAKEYVQGAIAGSAGWHLGRGHGPLDRLATRPAGASSTEDSCKVTQI